MSEEANLIMAKALQKIADQFERYMDLEEFKFFSERGLKGVISDVARCDPAIAQYEQSKIKRQENED